jgi:hypothetical protein
MSEEPRHLPNPEEIRQACREFQATWTPKEWRDHGEVEPPHWLPPGVCRSLAEPRDESI